MRLIGNKIMVRISKESINALYTKKIYREDGSTVDLFINVPAMDDKDERQSGLTVQSGIVEMVSDRVTFIKPGDVAILDYTTFNDRTVIFSDEPNGDRLLIIDPTSTYHTEDIVIDANRRTPRPTFYVAEGDIDYGSPLLGFIRNGVLFANAPFVFFAHEDVYRTAVSSAGIIYTEKERMLTRKVLACSQRTVDRFHFDHNDTVMVLESDIFPVKLADGRKIDCANDSDIIVRHNVVA